MEGTITKEHTVWCKGCCHWETYSEPKLSGMVKFIRSIGWKKVKGMWFCVKCLAGENK